MAETRYQVPVSKYRRIVFAAKVFAVLVFAVGIEAFTNQQLGIAVLLWVAAVVMSLWPVKIDITEDPEGAAKAGPAEGAGAKMHPLEEI